MTSSVATFIFCIIGRVHYNTTVTTIDRDAVHVQDVDVENSPGGTDGNGNKQHRKHAGFRLELHGPERDQDDAPDQDHGNSGNTDASTQPHHAYTRICGVLVIATGLNVPNAPKTISGVERAIGYEEMPKKGNAFEGKTVAILGMGNAAFETADAVAPYVNYVHLFAGRESQSATLQPGALESEGGGEDGGDGGSDTGGDSMGLTQQQQHGGRGPDEHNFLSWESRYPGNLRAINAGILDAYLLKSLDGGLPVGVAEDMYMVACGPSPARNMTCMFSKGPPSLDASGKVSPSVRVGRFSKSAVARDPWMAKTLASFENAGMRVNINADRRASQSAGGEGSINIGLSTSSDPTGKATLVDGTLEMDSEWFTVSASLLEHPFIVDSLVEFARRSDDPQPLQYGTTPHPLRV